MGEQERLMFLLRECVKMEERAISKRSQAEKSYFSACKFSDQSELINLPVECTHRKWSLYRQLHPYLEVQ